ncbi:glycogen operon protein [Actinobacillus equuli]|nr:glycogen operon protein [Actinobacillus equuli]
MQQIKLIAEPWDIGPEGYQVGHFPAGFAEWNDKYRTTMRSFFLGESGNLAEFARRLAGSDDLYWQYAPSKSINYFASHDGFTLQDLVSYNKNIISQMANKTETVMNIIIVIIMVWKGYG